MKKLLILFFCLVTVSLTAKADDDKPIDFKQLPQQAQQFVKQHFNGVMVSLVKMESDFLDKSYEVIFSNGSKVEFNKKGVWKEVNCKYSVVPDAVIPVQIRNYVSKNYPNVKILKIEKEDRQRHEVELSNGLDLKFDSKFNLIDIDN